MGRSKRPTDRRSHRPPKGPVTGGVTGPRSAHGHHLLAAREDTGPHYRCGVQRDRRGCPCMRTAPQTLLGFRAQELVARPTGGSVRPTRPTHQESSHRPLQRGHPARACLGKRLVVLLVAARPAGVVHGRPGTGAPSAPCLRPHTNRTLTAGPGHLMCPFHCPL